MRRLRNLTGATFAVAALAFVLVGCGTPLVPATTLVLSEASSTTVTASRDPVTIVEVRVEGDALSIDVEYGGGCEDHHFSLQQSGVFRESYPVQTDLSLTHDANGDLCRALVSRTLEFDLTPLKTLYQRSYATESGIIEVSLYAAVAPTTPATGFRYEF